MSNETYFIIDFVSFLLAAVILAFGALRALRFHRVLANETFRSRALWTAALLILWIVPNDTELLGYSSSASNYGATISLLYVPTVVIALVLIFAIIAFIDRNMRVSKELDFFHRDSLHWGSLRIIAYVAAPVCLLLGGNDILNIIGTIGLPLVLGYAALALWVSGARVRDRLMRSYLRYAGAGLFILVVGTIIVPSPGPPYGVIYDAFLLLGSYLLYFSARSLSPVNRMLTSLE